MNAKTRIPTKYQKMNLNENDGSTIAKGPMAKENTKKVNETEIANRVARMAQDAVGVSDTTIAAKQAEAFRMYMRKPLPGDEKIVGRSKYISNVIQRSVDLSVGTVGRVFDTQREPVSFQPNTGSPQDVALAKQMTEVVNFILRQKNKHFGFLESWLKNGFMSGLGVVTVKLVSKVKEGLPETRKGLTDEALAQLNAEVDAGKLSIVKGSLTDYYDAPMPRLPPGAPPQLGMLAQTLMPKVRDIQVRKKTKLVDIVIDDLAPEDFIISRDAKFDRQSGGIKSTIIGHKRVCTRSELIALGHDAAKVNELPLAEDDKSELALERSAVTDYDQGITGSDKVQVYEVYTEMEIDGEQQRNYRITLGGDLESAPVYLSHTEVTHFYPYAAFCPYPVPNTLFGQGVADRIGQEHSYISKSQRFVFDDLAQSANPMKVINPNVTNVDDALNMYPGAVIRSDDPTAGISWVQRQFTGGNSMGVIDKVSSDLEMSVGVGPNMMALNPSDMAETATAASQRVNQSQTFMESICRGFAEQGYSYLVKLIVDALVSNPEDAQLFIQRLTDQYQQIQIDQWDPNMDVSANVAFGVMNKDFQAAAISQIINYQMQAKQAGMRFVTDENIHASMAAFVENSGVGNAAMFFTDPTLLPPAPPPQPAPDPNAAVIEQMKIQGQIDLQIAQQKNDYESRKMIVEYDFKRDAMAQDKYIAEAEIRAKYGAQVDIARINAEQAATRNDVDIAMAQMDQQKEAMNQLAQIKMAEQQPQQAPEMPEQMPMEQTSMPYDVRYKTNYSSSKEPNITK
ncbi:portal protein [Ensifer adhaerens]|uniref:portal protein n=1 Tax=Ensifer adhaerens TaxID=106592 RepID=UPI003D077F30